MKYIAVGLEQVIAVLSLSGLDNEKKGDKEQSLEFEVLY